MQDRKSAGVAVPERSTPARVDVGRLAPATELRIALPFGVPALLCGLGSMLACYGGLLATGLFGLPALGFNPHVQAVAMWGLALLALYALWRDRRQHLSNLPLAIGALALLILLFTLYVSYEARTETVAYVLLVVAILLNQNLFLSRLNYMVRAQAQEIDELNQGLERRVESQEHEIDRLGRLKQFLAPTVAELVVSEGGAALLETHRRYIACLFCDIRDFTAASEQVEPEEVIALLQIYHDRVGALVMQRQGTIGYRSGDGLMVFFNDPIVCDEPVLDAVRLALDIQAAFADLRERWTKRGHPIGLGIGIASGYATLGLIGFRGRADYTAIGGVVNIASRLCDRAADGQILLSHRAYLDVEAKVEAASLGPLDLKGVRQPVEALNVTGLR
jgi:class 3 adenylate cyclase